MSGQADGVRLHAAGSLRAALTEVARDFTAAYGVPVVRVRRLGAAPRAARAGRGRRRLRVGEHGAPAGARAGGQGRSGRPVHPKPSFAPWRASRSGSPSDTLLDRMLDPGVALGTSTPAGGSRPATTPGRSSGGPRPLRPGSQARLEAKARQLVGRPDVPPAPGGPERLRSAPGGPAGRRVPDVLHERRPGRPGVPGLQVVALPAPLAVGADYGLTVLTAAHAERAAPPGAPSYCPRRARRSWPGTGSARRRRRPAEPPGPAPTPQEEAQP